MTEDRERELLCHVPTLRCAEEIGGFRAQLAAQGETPSGALQVRLLERERAVMPGGIRGGA